MHLSLLEENSVLMTSWPCWISVDVVEKSLEKASLDCLEISFQRSARLVSSFQVSLMISEWVTMSNSGTGTELDDGFE